MAFLKVKNRAISSLASAVSTSDTTWVMAAGEGTNFPSTGNFYITCESEIGLCTAVSGDNFTVTRAQEGTAAAVHASTSAVELRITAGVIDKNDDLYVMETALKKLTDDFKRYYEEIKDSVDGNALFEGY